MSSLAEEIANLTNTAPQSIDPEDDIYEETKAKVTTEDIEEEESKFSGNLSVGKRLQSYVYMGKEYSGKLVSRKDVDESSYDSDATSDEVDDSAINERLQSALELDEESAGEDEADNDGVPEESDKEEDDKGENGADDSENEIDEDYGDEEIDSDEADGEVSVFKKQDSKSTTSKGQATSNQMTIWEKILEARIRLQKPLSLVNKLPLPSNHDAFVNQDNSEISTIQHAALDSINNLINKLTTLQGLLVQQNDNIKMESEKNTKKRKSTLPMNELETIAEKRFKEIKLFRNKTLQFWYDKTRLSSTTNVNSNTFNTFERPTVSQIEEILSDKQRLLKRTQLQRTDDRILGTEKIIKTVEEDEVPSYNRHLKQYNKEIFNDDDFYQLLLRNLIEQKTSTNNSNNPADITRQWLKIQRLRSKVKNKVDHKAGKGRKVRYDVHPKLVSFMAPTDDSSFTHEARNRLFQSLFGNNNCIAIK